MKHLLPLGVRFPSIILAYAQKWANTNSRKISETHVTFLASDALKGVAQARKTNKKQPTLPVNLKWGLQPKGTNGFEQPFKANLDTVHVLDARNVVGYLDNADRTIIIGAHYDHLGEGFQRGSTQIPKGKSILMPMTKRRFGVMES
ncbi:MAG: hypothetical protein R2822_23800 [Spirosomataceae bacterium]